MTLLRQIELVSIELRGQIIVDARENRASHLLSVFSDGIDPTVWLIDLDDHLARGSAPLEQAKERFRHGVQTAHDSPSAKTWGERLRTGDV